MFPKTMLPKTRTFKYVECPRDSWQGFNKVIPVAKKVAYLQALLDAGFKHLDTGSFVSAQAVPQLADTEVVLGNLSIPQDADLLCIIANERGLERALAAKGVTSIGYPLSVNETFQLRNTRRSLAASWSLVEQVLKSTTAAGINFVVYVSMGFGNPYGEPWQAQDTADVVAHLRELGVQHIALADTVASATPAILDAVLSTTAQADQLGLHLHTRPGAWQPQLELALSRGLHWIEGAFAGIGGCPFAADELVGNLPSEAVLTWLREQGVAGIPAAESLSQLSAAALKLAEDYA